MIMRLKVEGQTSASDSGDLDGELAVQVLLAVWAYVQVACALEKSAGQQKLAGAGKLGNRGLVQIFSAKSAIVQGHSAYYDCVLWAGRLPSCSYVQGLPTS